MSVTFCDLTTYQGESLGEKVWQEYPRPQMRRESYLNLNGKWDFAAKKGKQFPRSYNESILVPFCPESALSGIHAHYGEEQYLFYRREVTLPDGFLKGRLLLHFGAVDQQVEVFINGRIVGKHIGGYNAFYLDITDDCAREMTLTLRIKDDLRDNTLPYGKQKLKRGGMWYTPVSGVWQSVWMESVPEKHIEDIKIDVTLNQTRFDNSVKEYELNNTMFFKKNAGGKWQVMEATNIDVQQRQEEVLLTFMHENEVLSSAFVDCHASSVKLPAVTAPEGMVFTGWAQEAKDESGNTTLTVVFEPVEGNEVFLPSGNTLQPMTLKALFEEA